MEIVAAVSSTDIRYPYPSPGVKPGLGHWPPLLIFLQEENMGLPLCLSADLRPATASREGDGRDSCQALPQLSGLPAKSSAGHHRAPRGPYTTTGMAQVNWTLLSTLQASRR